MNKEQEKKLKQILIKVRNGSFITPAIFEISKLFKEEYQEIIETIEKLIAKEMLICHKENQPTSRLTSLAVKIKNLTNDKYDTSKVSIPNSEPEQ